jgi:hypothetical protein
MSGNQIEALAVRRWGLLSFQGAFMARSMKKMTSKGGGKAPISSPFKPVMGKRKTGRSKARR